MGDTAPINAEPPVAEPSPPVVARKRRRRAPATGATEDCFTCRRRKVPCDRRRPYCTQCIDLGKECSGYRTVLTWGVGVASRGKLRGMSCPVVKPAEPPSTEPKISSNLPTKSVTSNPSDTAATVTTSLRGNSRSPATFPSPIVTTSAYDFINLNSSSPIPVPNSSPSLGWHVPGFHEHVQSYTAGNGKRNRVGQLTPRPLQRMQSPLAGSFDESWSISTGTLSTYSDSEYSSPVEYPQTPDEVSFASEPLFSPYDNTYLHPHASSVGSTDSVTYHQPPRSFPFVGDDLSSGLGGDHQAHDFLQSHAVTSPSIGSNDFPEIFYQEDVHSGTPCSSALSFGYSSPGSGVAGDGLRRDDNSLTNHVSNALKNPYRLHILPLAMKAEAVQYAVAALAANNMRMRTQLEYHPLRARYEQRANTTVGNSAVTADEFRGLQGEPTVDELQYKTMSIELLNMQLADASQARDDSVLATLLVLCLFHVCDSGFAKFATQAVGVRKLLALRAGEPRTGLLGLVELFFYRFDTLTSALNDYESQNWGDMFAAHPTPYGIGPVEHLIGCDIKLFNLIGHLGALNLRSQCRPVRENGLSHQENAPVEFFGLDGSDWDAPLDTQLSSARMFPGNEFATSDASSQDDGRYEFWTEWRLIRQRLQEWEPERPAQIDSIQSSIQSRVVMDGGMMHICEAFRNSALLYTERLAHPSVPSSAPKFQHFVSKTLSHVSMIRNAVGVGLGKFLLWAMFIAGSECVDEGQRALIRQRCICLHRDNGFFSSLTALELLETAWMAEAHPDSAKVVGFSDQALRWRKAMARSDGEYLII